MQNTEIPTKLREDNADMKYQYGFRKGFNDQQCHLSWPQITFKPYL